MDYQIHSPVLNPARRGSSWEKHNKDLIPGRESPRIPAVGPAVVVPGFFRRKKIVFSPTGTPFYFRLYRAPAGPGFDGQPAGNPFFCGKQRAAK